MSKMKIFRGIIVMVFLLAITLPMVTADFVGGQVSMEENRYLAKFPDLIKNGKLDINYREFSEWIGDNLGGRKRVMALNDRILYKISREHSGMTIEGKEEWLFLLPDYDVPEYTNINIANTDQLTLLVDHLYNVQEKFAEKNIGFVTAIYPRKYEVYPEYMPDTLLRKSEFSNYDAIAQRICQEEDLHFVAPKEELIAAKSQRLVYSKASDASHWNNFGAYIGYQALMSEIKEILPDIKILSESDFLVETVVLNTVKSNGFETSEEDLKYTLLENRVTANHQYLDEIGFQGTDQWRSWRYYCNEDKSLPKVVIVGDSYMWMFMLENMAQSFSELVFIHGNDISQLNFLVNRFQPDVVVSAFLGKAYWTITQYEPNFDNK